MDEYADELASLETPTGPEPDGEGEPSGFEDEVPAGPSRLRRWAGRALVWAGRLAVLLLFVALTPVVATGAVLSPFVMDDLALDRVVRAVALDWRDFGREAAESRLEYELDREGIGMQVKDEDCALIEDAGEKIVECSWQTAFVVPGVPDPVVLPFASRATIAENGDLR